MDACPTNPFPGMNPFLELRWAGVHTRLMVHLADVLEQHLPEGLTAQIEEAVAVETVTGPRQQLRADVLVEQSWAPLVVAAASSVAVSEPDVYTVIEAERSRYLEIVDWQSGNRVVTMIEVLSPAKKGSGRAAHLKKRALCREGNINFVEIDLLRGGGRVVDVPAQSVAPAKRQHPYHVSVSRGDEPDKIYVWHIGLLQPLPIIPIPLRTGDADVPVALQQMVEAVLREGNYARKIRYTEEMDSPLTEEGRRHLASVLGRGSE